MSAAAKKHPNRISGPRQPVNQPVWDRLVEAFERWEDLPDRFLRVAKAVGVGRSTAYRAYAEGLGQEWSRVPIRDILASRRAQKVAISSVLAAAKLSDVASVDMTPEERSVLRDALGATEFERLQNDVRIAVREEIALVDSTRRQAARALRAGEKLVQLFEVRADALLKKFGTTVGEDGKEAPPQISTSLTEEARILDVLVRTAQKGPTLARMAIEMERLRIGDPDALRRRLDTLHGGALGGPAGEKPDTTDATGADGGETEVEEPVAATEEVEGTDAWLGLRVIQGGKTDEDATAAEGIVEDASEDATDALPEDEA